MVNISCIFYLLIKKGETIYYPVKKDKTYLSSFNQRTKKYKIFTNKSYISIGLFSFAPDRKKLASIRILVGTTKTQ